VPFHHSNSPFFHLPSPLSNSLWTRIHTRTARFSGEPLTSGPPLRLLDHPVLYILLHSSSLPGSSGPYLRRSPLELQTTSFSPLSPVIVLCSSTTSKQSSCWESVDFRTVWAIAGKLRRRWSCRSEYCTLLSLHPSRRPSRSPLLSQLSIESSQVKSCRVCIDESALHISVD
jgi:hypothetical protein